MTQDLSNNTNHKKHSGILNSSMSNGLQINLKDAIEDVGGQVPSSACLWEYPEIIRKNLISKTLSIVNLRGGDIIKIDSDGTFYEITTDVDTRDLQRPNYANKSWKDDHMSADEVFEDLFDNILPNVRGIHAADMTSTDANGLDNTDWNNTLFNQTGRKSGLKSNAKYLRMYLTCQAEPLFVYIDANINNFVGEYNIQSSDTVDFSIDENTKTVTAHINYITTEQIRNLK